MMLRNYFKTGWRYILKNPFYSAVNIFGLSIGIAFTLLTCGFIWSEIAVNRDLKNVNQQYVLQSKWKNPGEGTEITTIGALPKALKENYPGLVANYFRFDGVTSIVSKNTNSFRESMAICDSTLFTMYGFRLLHGDQATAMREPFTVIITTEIAKKYFGKTNVVGQTLTIENFSGSKHDFQVTGVLQSPERNSVTGSDPLGAFKFFISEINHQFFNRSMSWSDKHIMGYIELMKGVQPARLNGPIDQLMKLNAAPQLTSAMQPYLVPLKKYYLSAGNGVVQKMIYALSGISVFILFMAVINFVNMSVSQSAARMREIGIRKVLGGLKKQLIIQFLAESVLLVSAATLFAILLFILSREMFGNLIGKEIPALGSYPLWFLALPAIIILGVGGLAGLYPAFVLSSFNTAASLKGKITTFQENKWLKKGLVSFQFGTALVVIIGANIISRQINLFLNKDLGYDKAFIVSAQVPRDWSRDGVQRMLGVRNRLAASPVVESVSLSYEIPNGNNAGQTNIYFQNPQQAVAAEYLQADENFLKVYKIPLLAGNFFKGNFRDSARVILNETAIKSLGLKNAEEAVGKTINLQDDSVQYTIAGIVKDFHFSGMQDKIPPTIFVNVDFSNTYRYLSFKLQPGNISANLHTLETEWRKTLNGAPFEFRFMDETLKRMYRSEIQLQKASFTATIMAMVIVLLGIVGMVSLSIQKRSKEIGIRKVLGSSVSSIVFLFIRDFFVIIFIGALIACPVAYYIMHQWLQGYAYQITITFVPFIMAVIILSGVTTLLIGLQTIRAAMANPVVALKGD